MCLPPNRGHWEVLKDFELHFIVAASSFIIAGGFIINSFYDLEKDLINRPHKALFDRIVSKSFCLNTYCVLNGIGLTFALFASWRVFLFYAFFLLLACGFTLTNSKRCQSSENSPRLFCLCLLCLASSCITNT